MVLVANKLYTGAIKESFSELLLLTMITAQAKGICSCLWKNHNFGFCWGALKRPPHYSMQWGRCKYLIAISDKHVPPFEFCLLSILARGLFRLTEKHRLISSLSQLHNLRIWNPRTNYCAVLSVQVRMIADLGHYPPAKICEYLEKSVLQGLCNDPSARQRLIA